MPELIAKMLASSFGSASQTMAIIMLAALCARSLGVRPQKLIRATWRYATDVWHAAHTQPVWLRSLSSSVERAAGWVAAIALGWFCAICVACSIAYTVIAATASLRGHTRDALFVIPALACAAIGRLCCRGALSLQRQITHAAH